MTFQSIKDWFHNSETILWARLQVLVGIVWTVLSTADLSPVLSGKYMTYWLVFSGVVTEMMRRRGTEVVNGSLRDLPVK